MSNEKLQALFDAALKAPEESAAMRPKPVGHISEGSVSPISVIQEVEMTPQVVEVRPVVASSRVVQPVEFDKAEAEELGELLDEQMAKQKSKRSRDFVLTMFVLGGALLGGVGWFVSDGQRVHAFMSVLGEIRSVSDIQSIVEKYQDSLDRVAVRSDQITQATSAMGVTASAEDLEDVHMEAEMKEMMGAEGGKTIGERNRVLQKNFGERAEDAGGIAKPEEGKEESEQFKKENAFGIE